MVEFRRRNTIVQLPSSDDYYVRAHRRLDRISVLESGGLNLGAIQNTGYRCQNCKERDFLVKKSSDDSNFFCTNCGQPTPIRSVRTNRGIAAPTIQQKPAIVQSENARNQLGSQRRPKGINRQRSELEQALLSRGYEVSNSSTIEPTG